MNFSDSLYMSVLDAYLQYFLPFTGSIPEPFSTSFQLQGSPRHYFGGSAPPGSSFYGQNLLDKHVHVHVHL